MKERHPLTQWAVTKIETEFKDDIALLIGISGHSTDNDAHGECFDYFIPATERGNELAQTFIINGVGHDLYPRSWERMAESAELKEMAFLLTNATILYARSQEDIARFQTLQKKLADNLADPMFMYGKALEFLDNALEIYRSFLFEEKSYRARLDAQYIHLFLSQAVASLNHTFTDAPIFSERQAYISAAENSVYHCPKMTLIPDGFFAYARQLLTPQDIPCLRETVHSLIRTTRTFVLERKPAATTSVSAPNYQDLADWYQEISLTWRRIRYFCKHNMIEEAYKDACYLQNELLYIAEEFHTEELNLLDSFIPEDLELLALRSTQLEQLIRQMIAEKGIPINEYDSIDAFLAANGGGKN